MLDTNIVSALARNPHGSITRRVTAAGAEAICISIITASELRYGCAKKGSPKLLAQIEAIINSLQVLPLDVPADHQYARIRAGLEAAGRPIGPNDLLIAAHAYALGAVLVTANVAEFERVQGLKIENWLE